MDLRIERTRTLLCQAFEGLMSEKPLQDISVSELCERAMIRRSTFYDHFADKADFVGYYIRRFRDELSAVLTGPSRQMPFADYCCAMTHSFLREVAGRPSAVRYLQLSDGLPQFSALVAKELAKELQPVAAASFCAEGTPPDRAQLKADMFANFYAAGLLGLMSWWIESDGAVSEQQFMDAYRETVAKMVSALL